MIYVYKVASKAFGMSYPYIAHKILYSYKVIKHIINNMYLALRLNCILIHLGSLCKSSFCFVILFDDL